MQIVKESAHTNMRCNECYGLLYHSPEDRDCFVIRVVFANVDGKWRVCRACLNKLFNQNEIQKNLKEE